MALIFNPDALILARARARLTLEQLSSLSGVSVAQINRYERGKVPPRPVTVDRLSSALGIEPNILYKEEL